MRTSLDPRISYRPPTVVRRPGGTVMTLTPGRWLARCPVCGAKVEHRARKYDWEALVPCWTRKEATDALRRHRRDEHAAGQAVRAKTR